MRAIAAPGSPVELARSLDRISLTGASARPHQGAAGGGGAGECGGALVAALGSQFKALSDPDLLRAGDAAQRSRSKPGRQAGARGLHVPSVPGDLVSRVAKGYEAAAQAKGSAAAAAAPRQAQPARKTIDATGQLVPGDAPAAAPPRHAQLSAAPAGAAGDAAAVAGAGAATGDAGAGDAGPPSTAVALEALTRRVDALVGLLERQQAAGGGQDTGAKCNAAFVSGWDVARVVAWLPTAGLAAHAALFRAQGIRGADLADLCHEDLASIGVARLTERKAVLRAVARLLAAPAGQTEC